MLTILRTKYQLVCSLYSRVSNAGPIHFIQMFTFSLFQHPHPPTHPHTRPLIVHRDRLSQVYPCTSWTISNTKMVHKLLIAPQVQKAYKCVLRDYISNSLVVLFACHV